MARDFFSLSASRLLVMGGLALIAAGMIFGDVFAVFVLHQNAGRIGERLQAAAQAVSVADGQGASRAIQAIGGMLENRGTKVDAHVHAVALGYLALLLAIVQPYVALDERRRRRLAELFLGGAVLLPVSVFLIHYVGLRYSPLSAIGWASIAADVGGLLVIVACCGALAGLLRGRRQVTPPAQDHDVADQASWCSRMLLTGGTILVLAGFLHGGYYAVIDLDAHEALDAGLLHELLDRAAAGDELGTAQTLARYGALQADKAVAIAAHAHIIEFGLLAMLLAFIQPYVWLSEPWRRRWVVALLAGSAILPVFVLLEVRWGLVAGGVADLGGLLVVAAVLGMLAGVLRHTGRVDALERSQ